MNDKMMTSEKFSEALRTVAHGHVAFPVLDGVRCQRNRLHWNGSEIVVCSVGPAPWSELDHVRVAVSLEGTDIEVQGVASVDRVIGVAPEYREAAVRALGADAGHAESDQLGSTVEMYRLFITPS